MRARKATRAFTVVELLISVSLMAVVLTALALAVNTIVASYEANREAAALSQVARSLLGRMTRQIRQAEDVEGSADQIIIHVASYSEQCDEIRYVLQDGDFVCKEITDGAVTAEQVLLAGDDDVRVQSFTAAVVQETRDGETYAVLATVRISFASREDTMSVTASAAPRRNLIHS